MTDTASDSTPAPAENDAAPTADEIAAAKAQRDAAQAVLARAQAAEKVAAQAFVASPAYDEVLTAAGNVLAGLTSGEPLFIHVNTIVTGMTNLKTAVA